mgnify:CR=1 FL=1
MRSDKTPPRTAPTVPPNIKKIPNKAPVETVEIQSSLHSISAYENVSAVVRPAGNDPILIKRICGVSVRQRCRK